MFFHDRSQSAFAAPSHCSLILCTAAVFISYIRGRKMSVATCFFPSGFVSPADVPCEPEDTYSFCCFTKQACLSNKLCLTGVVDGVNQYARGTCTDHSWESGACPDFCLNREFNIFCCHQSSNAYLCGYLEQNLGNAVFSCNETGTDTYCCDPGCSCAPDSGDEVLSFSGTPYTLTAIDIPTTYPNPSATSTSTSSLVVTTSSSSQTSTATSSPASAPTASSASSSVSSSTKGSSNSTAVGAGVGVGVGVAVLVVGAAGLFLYYRRKRNAHQPYPMGQDQHSSSVAKQPDHTGLPGAANHHSELELTSKRTPQELPVQ